MTNTKALLLILFCVAFVVISLYAMGAKIGIRGESVHPVVKIYNPEKAVCKLNGKEITYYKPQIYQNIHTPVVIIFSNGEEITFMAEDCEWEK